MHQQKELLNRLLEYHHLLVDDIPLDDYNVFKTICYKPAGISECCSPFWEKMIKVVKPNSVSDLAKLLALSRGTGTWADNAKVLLIDGVCDLTDVISTGEDVIKHLMSIGCPEAKARSIADMVGGGRVTSSDDTGAYMRSIGLPAWYIDSCSKIGYLYHHGKAMDTALLSYKLAWFKYYHTNAFYDAFLSIYGVDYDVGELLLTPSNALEWEISNCDYIMGVVDPVEYGTLDEYNEFLSSTNDHKMLLQIVIEMKSENKVVAELYV